MEPGSDEKQTDMLPLHLLKELGEQRELISAHLARWAKERRRERRISFFLKAAFVFLPMLFGLGMYLHTAGYRPGPVTEVIGIVRVEGEISSDSKASADKVVPALERAFKSDRVTKVVIAIDSPGGTPGDSERIAAAIDLFKKRYNKPTIAVIQGVGASAAYLVAMHADEVVAGRYSLVGSIGAIMAPWQLDKAMSRLDVSQKVYASGKLKAFLNPFTPVTKEVDEKAHSLVNGIGKTFVNELAERRGKRLAAGVDFSTGEVWTGQEAKALGLVDRVATLEDIVEQGDHLDTHDFGPRENTFTKLSAALSAAVSNGIRSAVEGPGVELR